MLYLFPELIQTPELPDTSDFSSSALGSIYDKLCEKIRNGEMISMDTLASTLSREEMELLAKIIQGSEIKHRSKNGMGDCIKKIKYQKEIRESRKSKNKEDIALAAWRMRQNEMNEKKK